MKAPVEIVLLSWLRPHEEYDEGRARELVERMRATGRVDYAVVADRTTGTVVDGHHRLEALRRLGATRAPALLVDYMDPAITVLAWRKEETAPTKADVVRHALEGRLYPPKTTRHDFIRSLDPVDVPLADLVGSAHRSPAA